MHLVNINQFIEIIVFHNDIMKINFPLILKLFLLAFVVIVLLLCTIRIVILLYSKSSIVSLEDTPHAKVVIVFGAGLRRDSSPTPILGDRVSTAVDLYKAGKVEKILMTGDNQFVDYNEPASMAKFAEELGVPEKDIILDPAGRSTYDSCFRAKVVFGLDQAILVTQSFHLPRAIYLCDHLGVKSIGFSADRRQYLFTSQISWQLREIVASAAAIWDIWIGKPTPVLENPEPILNPKTKN
jgi:SanA protein